MRPKKHALAFALLVCAVAPAPLRADPLEDEYLKARDAYIVRFDPGDKEVDYDKIDKAEKEARDDLQARLRKIIGAPQIKGATGDGNINLLNLVKGEMEFGNLDGLVYKMDGGRAQVVVTTIGLLQAWLRGHADWWGKDVQNVPQDVTSALADEDFYTQALSRDAAVTKFTDLPVTKPEGVEFALALLDRRQQANGSGAPDEIIVSILRGGRLYVVAATAQPKPNVIAACEKVWKKTSHEGDHAFHACYAERVKGLPVYRKFVAQAQRLIDAVAGK